MFLEAANPAHANKTKESIFHNLGSPGFWRIDNSVLNKGESVIPPFFKGFKVLSSTSDKSKLLEENCSKNSDFDNLAITLPALSDRIARSFKRSAATQAIALDITKVFDRVWHAGVLQKLMFYAISG